MNQTRILALVGSLRAESVNRQLAEAAVHLASDGVEVTIHEGIGDIPFYNEDIDVPGSVPAAAQALRDAVAPTDALLFVTPEYNGTLPAVLKNAVDWLSRPFGAGALSEKPVAVVSASISDYGAKWAHGDTVKTVGIAGGKVVEEAHLHFATIGSRFAEVRPVEDAEALRELGTALDALIGASQRQAVSA